MKMLRLLVILGDKLYAPEFETKYGRAFAITAPMSCGQIYPALSSMPGKLIANCST